MRSGSTVGSLCWIKLRNPHNQGEWWSGAWSDNSPDQNELHDELSIWKSGNFWMELGDVLK